MTWYVTGVVRLFRVGQQAYARKWSFLGVFGLIFLGSVSVLNALDLLPEAYASTLSFADAPVGNAVQMPEIRIEEPVRIAIPAISLAATISNPTTTNIETLDTYLLKGAVRYPTSAKLGEEGNVVLFGHSSYLPVVGNQAYKAFNGIQKLVAGDTITVSSEDRVYTYRVRTMTKANADDAGIPLMIDGRVLTLATCDSFGKKTDRFVVVADFVESEVIPL